MRPLHTGRPRGTGGRRPVWAPAVFLLALLAALAGSAAGAAAQSARPAAKGAGPDMVCVGTRGYGVSCLVGRAWVRWTKAGGHLASDFIYTVAACHGRILVSAGKRVHEFDDTGRRALRKTPGGHARRFACDPRGGYWIAGGRTLARWTGKRWQVFRMEEVLKAARAGWVNSLTVDRRGHVWVVASGRVAARFDGKAWKLFTADDGLPERWRLTGVLATPKGQLWLSHDRGLARRDGDTWRSVPGPGSAHVMAADPSGALWLGYYGRVTRLAGKSWKRFWLKGQVRGLAAGRDGRIWAASRYGLSVYDGKRWQARRMADSGLPSNDLAGIAVLGTGSALPKPVTKTAGSLKLRLEWDTGDAVANARVELCAAPPSIVLQGGRSPCRGRPLRRVAKTNTAGAVAFRDLPPANYYLAILPQDGPQWLISFSARRTRVTAGRNLDIGTWRLRAAEHRRRLP